MPRCGNRASRRDSSSFLANTDGQGVDDSRHDATDASFHVILGAVRQMIQRLQRRLGRARLLGVDFLINIVSVIFTDLVEHCLPLQLGRKIVEEGADLERATDEHTQLTQSMQTTSGAVRATTVDTATFYCTLYKD